MKKFLILPIFIFYCSTAFCGTSNSNDNRVVISFHFNEKGGSWTATSGKVGGVNTTLTGGATFVTGKFGGGVSFDGTSDGVVTTASSSAWGFTTAYTVIAWVKMSSAGAQDGTIAAGSQAGNPVDSGWSFHFDAPGKMTVCHWTVACVGRSLSISYNTWLRLGCVYDGTRLYYYVNGVSDESDALGNAVFTAAQTLKIGDQDTLTDFNGEIDEVILYDTALTSREMMNDYLQFRGNTKFNNEN